MASERVSASVNVTMEVTVTVGTWDATTSLAELRKQACREAEQALRNKLQGRNVSIGPAIRMGAVVFDQNLS
jgi:hypothetical protein